METERIYLRPWCEHDVEALFKYASDPDVGPRAGWTPHKNKEESRRIIREVFSNDFTWAIEWKETGEAIGCIGYLPSGVGNIPLGPNDTEVGYWVAKPYWNRGICTDALLLLIDYCFCIKHFETLWADHCIGNPASGRVLQKCGFVDTGAINTCSHLCRGDMESVKIYKLCACQRPVCCGCV